MAVGSFSFVYSQVVQIIFHYISKIRCLCICHIYHIITERLGISILSLNTILKSRLRREIGPSKFTEEKISFFPTKLNYKITFSHLLYWIWPYVGFISFRNDV